MFSIRSRTSSGGPACLNTSLGFSGSRFPSAHWPSLRAFAGRAVVIGVLLQKDRQRGQHSSPTLLGGAEPSASWRRRGAGSATSGQTDTATDALEIDVPSRHER